MFRQRLVKSLAVLCLIIVCGPAAAQKKAPSPASARQYIFSRSTTPASSSYLGVTCVPAYVVLGNANRRGIYVTAGGNSLASTMGLRPGCVLLTLDNRVIENASNADNILSAKAAGTLDFSYVQLVGGQPQVVSRNCTFTGARAQSNSNSFAGDPAAAKRPQPSIAELEKYMFSLVNEDRTKQGVSTISENSKLSSLARSYAEYMVKKGSFSHVDPDGRDPQTRAKEAGIRCGVYENLAFNTRGIADRDGVKRAEDQMMGEPPDQQNHRYNILLPKHKYVGVGVARNEGKLLMVQEFSDDDP